MKQYFSDQSNISTRFVFTGLFATAGIMLSAGNALADESKMVPASGPGWIITVGAMGIYSPEYAGSKDNSWGAMPILNWRREGQAKEFDAPDDGFGFALINTHSFKMGPVFALSDGRSAKDDPRLAGLREYSTSLEAGVFVDYWLIDDLLRTRLELRHGFRGDDGFALDVGADIVKRYGRFTLSAGPRLSFLDSDQMQLKYGVTQTQADANGIVAPFNASAGIESVGINFTASYEITPQVTLTVYDRFDYLVGDAGDSPITRQLGSKNQNTIGVGLSYSFHTGQW